MKIHFSLSRGRIRFFIQSLPVWEKWNAFRGKKNTFDNGMNSLFLSQHKTSFHFRTLWMTYGGARWWRLPSNSSAVCISNLICRHTPTKEIHMWWIQRKGFQWKRRAASAGLRALDLMMRRALFLFVFKQAFLLLMECRPCSVSGEYKCSSKAWLCPTIHKLLMPHSNKTLAGRVQAKSKNQWRTIDPNL